MINLLHHPLSWLWPEDKKILRPYLNNAMTLSGHLHDAGGGYLMDLSGNSFQLQAGGAYLGSESKWPARYQYITVDWAEAAVQVDFRKFAREKRIWSLDGETGEDGIKVFRNTGIIKITQIEKKEERTPQPPSPLSVLPAGYLEWLKGNCAYMDIENLQGKGSPISIRLPEIFIPLLTLDPESDRSIGPDTERHQYKGVEKELGGSDGEPENLTVSTDDIESLLQAPGRSDRTENKIDLEKLIGRYDTLLVEGHPGSGKSTLFKHIAYCLATGESVSGIENYLPVLLPLKDLKGYFDDTARGVTSAVSVENILAHWLKIKAELISVETILAFCKVRKILFLMDGLDEIGQKTRDSVAYHHRIESSFNSIEPRCGLLKQEDGEYLFWHLTFQEFLTALHIVDNHMDYIEAIGGYWERDNFREVIKLFIGYLSIENKNWANGIVKEVLENKGEHRKVLLASSALVDIQENRRDETTVAETRKSLVSIIELAPETELIVEAGENLGRLKDHRDLKEFIKIEGGEYDLEDIGKTRIEPFELGKYPVTNGWFGEFIKDGGYEKPGHRTRYWSLEGQKWLSENIVERPRFWNERKWNCPNAPVVGVCWYGADAFTKWLTAMAQNGYTYRLPSEKEWQAAAAGFSKRVFPWGGKWDRKNCNSRESEIQKISPVGIFSAGNTPRK